MIHDFYHNTREEIKELEARIRNYDTKMQEAEMKHRTDVASHMQKVKHLEYEHGNNQKEVRKKTTDFMAEEKKIHTDNEKEMINLKRGEKKKYSETDKLN